MTKYAHSPRVFALFFFDVAAGSNEKRDVVLPIDNRIFLASHMKRQPRNRMILIFSREAREAGFSSPSVTNECAREASTPSSCSTSCPTCCRISNGKEGNDNVPSHCRWGGVTIILLFEQIDARLSNDFQPQLQNRSALATFCFSVFV